MFLSEGRGGVVVERRTPNRDVLGFTQGAKSLYLAKNRLEVTPPAIVVLKAFCFGVTFLNERCHFVR